MFNHCEIVFFIIILLIVLTIRNGNDLEFMDNVENDNIYYPVELKERAYKIYNYNKQKNLIGINSDGKLGDIVEKWLFVIKYEKKQIKGAKSNFKAFLRSGANGRWLGIMYNNILFTTDEHNKVLFTFTPIGNNNYTISTENGMSVCFESDKLIVANCNNKLIVILDSVY